MNFLNPWLLFGALGIGLPILAHLLNRNVVKHTDWAAMRFLNRSVKVRSRQLRLRDLLLLLLRCLAILFFCLALARPGWRGMGSSWLTGTQRPGVVIALDASYSMLHGADETRFERAIQQVNLIAGQIRKGDRLSLVMLAAEPRVVVRNMAFEPERFQELLAALTPVPERLNLDVVPGHLRELVDEMDALQKEIYLITDVQSRDWSALGEPTRDAFDALARGRSLFLLPVRGEAENLALARLDLVSGVPQLGSVARYRAGVRNFGTLPASNVRVEGRVEEHVVDTKIIPRIAPGAEESVSLFLPLHNSGSQRISAVLPDDVLEEDNIRRTVAYVREHVSVLCVDGSSGDAGALVVAALQAHDRQTGGESVRARAIPWLSLPSQNLADVNVLILTDVPELTPRQAERLEGFVRRGNGLIWFAGPNVNAAKWNEHAGALLPGRLGLVAAADDRSGAGTPLERSMSEHPVLRPLLSLPEDLFNETRFLRHVQVEPHASSDLVLTLAAGSTPILLEQALGRGHVFMCASTADPAWNNMAATPVFPMLVQQMVHYLAGRAFQEPRRVGDALSLWFEAEPDASDAVFESPSGEEITVPVQPYGNQYVALLDKAREAGYYLARVSVQAPGMPIAVNVDTRESDVRCLPDTELREAVAGAGMTIATTEAELLAGIDQARARQSLWRLFMLAALLALVAESVLADRMTTARSRPAGSGRGVQDA